MNSLLSSWKMGAPLAQVGMLLVFCFSCENLYLKLCYLFQLSLFLIQWWDLFVLKVFAIRQVTIDIKRLSDSCIILILEVPSALNKIQLILLAPWITNQFGERQNGFSFWYAVISAEGNLLRVPDEKNADSLLALISDWKGWIIPSKYSFSSPLQLLSWKYGYEFSTEHNWVMVT